MTVVLTIIAVLFAIPLVLLVVPFHLRAAGAIHEDDVWGEARVLWGFGLLAVVASFSRGVELRLLGLRVFRLKGGRRKKKEKKRKEKEPKEEKEKKGDWRAFLRNRSKLLEWTIDLLRPLCPRLRARGIIGLDDPANTAVLYGVLSQLRRLPRTELAVETDWAGDALELDVEVEMRLWLAHLLVVCCWILLNPGNWKTLKELKGAM